MDKVCDCYRTRERLASRYSPTSGGYIGCVEETVSYCIGTREQDLCSCGGDRSKCNFYPEKRTDLSVDTLKYENEQLSRSYDAMLRDLQFRTSQLREAQEEIERLRLCLSGRARFMENEKLREENERLKKKLDAVIGDMKKFSIDFWKDGTRFPCDWCKSQLKDGKCQWKLNNPKNDGCYGKQFKWRGEED